MNLEDLIKLAGVTKSPYDTPVQEQPTEIEEQPVMDDAEGMRTLIALVTPEQLNQLQGQAPVEEEGFANSGDEYAGEPEEYKGTLGSPADLSLRRYLGANGEHVTVDETKVYEDHKVEDITEAWQAYKAEPVEEAVVDEDDVEEDNAFNSAAANAKKAGKKNFTFNGKSYPVKIDDKTADALTDSVNEGGMKQAEIEVQDWVKKYDDNMGVNGDSLPEGYLQAMLNTGIMSDAFDQDEYIAFNEKNGYEDDGDWDEDDHDKFMASSPITSGMFSEIRAIQEKYGIDEQGVNDIMGYFESVNRLKSLAGI